MRKALYRKLEDHLFHGELRLSTKEWDKFWIAVGVAVILMLPAITAPVGWWLK